MKMKANSADITIREAIIFATEKIDNCVFTDKEIEQIFRASFAARRADSERRADLIGGIQRIIETATHRVNDSSAKQ